MCGRFALFASGDEVAARFLLAEAPLFDPRYNIAPTQAVATVRVTPAGRAFALCRWGLIPSWSSDPAIGNKLINARSETVADKPSFRSAFKQRRCLIPRQGFTNGRSREPDAIGHRPRVTSAPQEVPSARPQGAHSLPPPSPLPRPGQSAGAA